LKSKFDLDENGEIKLQPVTGFTIAPVATIAVLLQIEYVENQTALETQDTERKQFVIYPQQALEIAEALRRAAEPLLGPLPLGDLIR
jgi:hypothetical protein